VTAPSPVISARWVALTTGGVTRLLDRMVAAGPVERVPCPTDRRITFAVAHPGRPPQAHEAAAPHVRNREAVFAGFTADDLRTLDTLLERLPKDRDPGTPRAAPPG
jgi:MarR family 2-MHQ and catechol resistance regulon transcriptional repressor